jgi:uncharacterized protein (DUF3084 family)
MSAVTAGSYVRLFQLSKALEQTLADLGKMNAERIAERLNRETEKERNDLRAELISAHGENEVLLTELAATQRELAEEREKARKLREALADVREYIRPGWLPNETHNAMVQALAATKDNP